MTKQKFSEILLSRFQNISAESKCDLIELLLGTSASEETEIFQETAETITELLFPEVLGEVKEYDFE